MERYIKTKSGKVIEILACTCPNMYSGRNLFISCIGISIYELMPIVADENEISIIKEYYNDSLVHEYTGYTVLLGVNINIGDNAIELNLSIPENEEEGVWEVYSEGGEG